jgi:hypothetical protein
MTILFVCLALSIWRSQAVNCTYSIFLQPVHRKMKSIIALLPVLAIIASGVLPISADGGLLAAWFSSGRRLRKSNVSNIGVPNDVQAKSEKTSLRFVMRARISLMGMDAEELSAEHIVFLEETWIKVYNGVFSDSNGSNTTSMVVEEVVTGDDIDYRRLHGRRISASRDNRGERSLVYSTPGRWFDVWALFDFTCKRCTDDRKLNEDHQSDNLLSLLEKSLCEHLRNGSFRELQSVDRCLVVYD